MDDATKAAVEWLRGWYCTAPTDAQPGTIAYRVRLLLAHLDGEPERLAAKAEEVREACARHLARVWYGLPDGGVAALGTVACVRTTPLDARPLADRIEELERALADAVAIARGEHEEGT